MMTVTPERGLVQRLVALEAANEIRYARAEFKRDLRRLGAKPAYALELMRRIGRKPAARQLGVSVNTLHRWEKPDLYARQLAGSAAAKRRRKLPCVRGCGRLTSYDRPDGVCIECTIEENRAAHGTRSRYTGGCRCPACREAVRIDARRRRWRGDAPSHGLSGYKNYGCRCATCTAANSEHCREQYQRRRAS